MDVMAYAVYHTVRVALLEDGRFYVIVDKIDYDETYVRGEDGVTFSSDAAIMVVREAFDLRLDKPISSSHKGTGDDGMEIFTVSFTYRVADGDDEE